MSDDDVKKLVAEARRLGQGDWCLSVPNVAKAVLNQLADALEAARQAPAVDREALAQGVFDAWQNGADHFGVADSLVASGILQDAAALSREVEARGLEKAADIAEHPTWHPLGRLNDAEQTVSVRIAHAVRSFAQQVREGN